MYNLNGLIFRIWGVGGILFAFSLILLACSRFWNPLKCNKAELIAAVLGIAIALVYGGIYCKKIQNPSIISHEGYFEREYRDSTEAPPLPVTFAYVFSNNGQPKLTFYLDAFSRKKIFNCDFEKGVLYRIYYEESSHIIVNVEILNSDYTNIVG